MRIIVLYPAHYWECLNCNCDNFEKSIILKITEENIDELIEELGVDEDDEGKHVMGVPEDVTCSFCGEKYSTMTFEEEEEENEDSDDDDEEY